MEIELAPNVWIAEDGLRLQYARSGGPGGQNVNKLNTKAELWVRLGAIRGLSHAAVGRLRTLAGRRVTMQDEFHLSSESERGQEGNRAVVMQRLREMIVQAKVEPKVRRKSKVSRAAKARRVDAKKRRGAIKSMRRGGSQHE